MTHANGGNAELDVALIARLRAFSDQRNDAGYLQTINDALKLVHTQDTGEPLVPLNHETLGNRVFVWLVELGVPADESQRLKLRKTVVGKLRDAAHSLPKGYSLIIRDAFRTDEMVWRLYELYIQRLKVREPGLTESDCDVKVRNILAMPDDPVPPGHMTGGAVDVNLGDERGQRVDLELPENEMPRSLQAPMFCVGLPSKLVERRKVLYESMIGQGFHNYFREYWHYSYGDAYWAVRRLDKRTLYGIPRST
jgi:D-alanyl-D-alanine dipeptidase